MSTSTDGGLSWSAPIQPAGHDKGLGGQPVVQPNGTVIVPFESLERQHRRVPVTDGGAIVVQGGRRCPTSASRLGGGLRTSPLPTAEIDAAATSTSRGRTAASGQVREPTTSCSRRRATAWIGASRPDPDRRVASAVDHFIPGLASTRRPPEPERTSGLTYYYYPKPPAARPAGSTSATSPRPTAAPTGARRRSCRPMALSQIAQTSQGPMVGDYISTSFSGGRAATVLRSGKQQPTSTSFDEASYAPTTPLTVATTAQATRSATTTGAGPGIGTGETHHALKNN